MWERSENETEHQMNTSIYILYFYIASSRCKTNNRTTATNERTDRLPRSSFVALLILARMISCGVPSGLLTAPQLADHIIHCPSSSTALIEKTDADGPPLCCGEVCNEPTGSAVLYVWVCVASRLPPWDGDTARPRIRSRERERERPDALASRRTSANHAQRSNSRCIGTNA